MKNIFTRLQKIAHFLSKPSVLLILLLVMAAFFRLVSLGNFSVGFDQVQIVSKANEIVKGDISLIGPRTGPANMFTGPLIYYITAPFVYLGGNFMAIIFVPALLSLITGTTLFLLTRRYLGNQQAILVTAFWAFSPFIVSLDRIFWNPNLMLLSTLLVFIPLLLSEKQKPDKFVYIALLTGSFLAYQAHFSGFLLVLLVIFSIVLFKLPKRLIFMVGLGQLVSLLPTLVFDLRNNWLNVRGFLALVSERGVENVFSRFSDIFHNAYILIETFGKVMFFGSPTQTILVAGSIGLGLSLVCIKNTRLRSLLIFWLVAIAVLYSFYRGAKPEYYFLIAVVPFLFVLSDLVSQMGKKYQWLILVFFFANSAATNFAKYQENSGMTVGNIQEIHSFLETQQVQSITYDLPYGTDFGISYLLEDIPLNEEGESFHISFPHNFTFRGLTKISDVGVWADQRSSENNYVSRNAYFIQTEKSIFVLKNDYPQVAVAPSDQYEILKNNQVVGHLSIAESKNDQLEWVAVCRQWDEGRTAIWTNTSSGVYLTHYAGHCFQLKLDNPQQITANEISIF